MHKHIGLLIFTVCVGIILLVPTLADKLFALFFIGLVPFTHYTLPIPAMLAAYALLLAIGLYMIARQLSLVANPAKRAVKSRELARKKVLHRTAKAHPKTVKTHPKKRYLPATEN